MSFLLYYLMRRPQGVPRSQSMKVHCRLSLKPSRFRRSPSQLLILFPPGDAQISSWHFCAFFCAIGTRLPSKLLGSTQAASREQLGLHLLASLDRKSTRLNSSHVS